MTDCNSVAGQWDCDVINDGHTCNVIAKAKQLTMIDNDWWLQRALQLDKSLTSLH